MKALRFALLCGFVFFFSTIIIVACGDDDDDDSEGGSACCCYCYDNVPPDTCNVSAVISGTGMTNPATCESECQSHCTSESCPFDHAEICDPGDNEGEGASTDFGEL